MLGSRFCVRTLSGVGSAAADHTNVATTARSVPCSVAVDFSPLHLSPLRSRRRFRCRRSILISCNSSRRRSSSDNSHDNNNKNDYLEASLLLSGYSLSRHVLIAFIQDTYNVSSCFSFSSKEKKKLVMTYEL